MLLYNTTFAIEPSIEQEFLQWLHSEFIPSATADGQYFDSPELFRIESRAGDDAISFALHLRASSRDEIETWYADHGSRLLAYLMQHWNGRALCFSTTLTALPCPM